MERIATFRCDLCRRPVDTDTSERARHAWQPLVICEQCVREADTKSPGRQAVAAASAS
jgi:hypothetical protein